MSISTAELTRLMISAVPHTLLMVATLYGGGGAAVAAAFLLVGLDRVDPGARGSYAFRPLLVPGLVMLWPLVLYCWRARARGSH